MPLTPRNRVVLSCLATAVLSLVALGVFHWLVDSLGCQSGVVRVTHTCTFGTRHRSLAEAILAFVVGLVLVALSVAMAIWSLQPIGALTQMVRRLGPQSLAERAPIGSLTDETGQLAVAVNEMMDRLAAGYEGQRSFAANASHELRTPLAVQRTLIEVSMAGARSPSQLALLTEQLLATNERNERLIEGLLVLSESDRGLVARTPQRLDLITAHVVDAHRDLAAKSGVSVSSDLTECVIAGEEVLLERLVTNLVRNAIIYNVEGGEVRVTVTDAGQLVVENTGVQIPAETVDGLFEPFRRGTADRTHHGGGAGLGLTIVRSICAAHDGAVSAHTGPHGGLRVEVSIPTTRANS
jgi:signal transduction histidine kinase